jgi:hypothetical protein
MQQEKDSEAVQHQSLPTNTELWQKRDLNAFVEALHSI